LGFRAKLKHYSNRTVSCLIDVGLPILKMDDSRNNLEIIGILLSSQPLMA
jgi:hypothetical protein